MLWLTTARRKCDQWLSKVRSMKPAASRIAPPSGQPPWFLVEQVARRRMAFASSDGSQKGHTNEKMATEQTELASSKTTSPSTQAAIIKKASVRRHSDVCEANQQRQTALESALATPAARNAATGSDRRSLSTDREQRQRPPPSSPRDERTQRSSRSARARVSALPAASLAAFRK
jgi:hypothetical protein